MTIDIDDLHKTLAIISLFMPLWKALSSFVSRKIEDPNEKNIPKPEELDINIFNEIKYYDRLSPHQLDESGKNNLKNALIFKKITNKNAPIHTINLIFNCYGPATALFIYSRAEKYIHFNKKNELKKPEFLERKMHKCLLYGLHALSHLSIFTSLVLASCVIALVVVMLKEPSQIPEDRIVQASSILLFFIAFSIGSLIVSFRMLNESSSYRRLYKKTIEFYDAHIKFKKPVCKSSQ